jgi:hypothetical protein
MTWPDGAVYSGQFIMDKCNGYGTMRFPNGSVFEGQWVRSNPHGDGKLTTVNQEVLQGYWEHYGRSNQMLSAVGKYMFRGELIDLKSGERRQLAGPLALYLTSGLVALPNMADPLLALLPFAEVIIDADANGKPDKFDYTPTINRGSSCGTSYTDGDDVFSLHRFRPAGTGISSETPRRPRNGGSSGPATSPCRLGCASQPCKHQCT